MTAIAALQSTIASPDVSTPQPVTLPRFRCAFCPDAARPGSLYCQRCAAGLWDELRHLDARNPLPSLDEIRQRIFAKRQAGRQREIQRIKREYAAQQQLAPVAIMPMKLLLDERFKGSIVAPRVYAAVAAMGGDARWVPYNSRTLALQLGYNLQTVRRAMPLLIERGYLERQRVYNGLLIRCRLEA